MLTTIVVVCTAAVPSALGQTNAAKGYPRIAVRDGQFIDTSTGQTYTPIGANYAHVMLLSDGRRGHAVFSPAYYDPKDIDGIMSNLQANGMNTLRAFQDYDIGKDGIALTSDAASVSPRYMADVIDFLQAVRRHKLNVIFTWDTWNPHSASWESKPLAGEKQYPIVTKAVPSAGVNNQFVSIGWVRIRTNAILSLIDGIKKVDPDLLNVVLAWELQNEMTFVANQEPLKSRPSHYEDGGKIYDLSTDAGTQKWMDDAAVRYAALACGPIKALAFLLFLAGADYNRIINQEGDGMGGVARYAGDQNLLNPKFPNEDFHSVFRSVMDRAQPEQRSPFVDSSAVELIITTQLDLVRRDAKSAAEAMQTATAQIQEQIQIALRRDPSLRQRYDALTTAAHSRSQPQ